MKRFLFSIIIFTVLCFLSYAEEGFTHLATISGDSTGDRYSIVDGGGDVNGDGYNDLIVGAPGGNYAELFLGGPDFDTIPEYIFKVRSRGSGFGKSVSIEGDLNSDGFDDIIIGSHNTGPNNNVHVYFGASKLDTIPDIVLTGSSYFNFGHKVLSGFDINGDEYDDFIMSTTVGSFFTKGVISIYLGGPDSLCFYTSILGKEGDVLGTDIDYVGDINKDGCDDLIVGADQHLISKPGKAYLIYGGEEINLDSSTVFYGDSINYPHGYFGRYVSGLGDVNGDGYPDIGIVGGDYVQVISGKSLDVLFNISNPENEFGDFYSLTGGKDVNNDEIPDMALCLQNAPNNSTKNNILFYKGHLNLDSIPNYMISRPAEFGYFNNISFIGDINNDKNNEIAFGETPMGKGKVYIYSYSKTEKIKNTKNMNVHFNLKQNYPNPFNSKTKIQYYIPKKCNMELSIYDFLGQKIKTLESGYKNHGRHSIYWNGKDEFGMNVPSGIYFYKLITSSGKNTVIIRKMIYLK